MPSAPILGVDIGGTAIKAAIVDPHSGKLLSDFLRIPTPKPATPKAIATALKSIVDSLNWQGVIGCGFPATVQNGTVLTASNIDPTWIQVDAENLFSQTTGCSCFIVNDADAAGIAEMALGVGQQLSGLTLLLTLGTGIGSALFINQQLWQNTELGHVKFQDTIAEKYCAESTRIREQLSWESWGMRLNEYLLHLEFVLHPDTIIIGGGVAESLNEYRQFLTIQATILPAANLNQAGIIGAAIYAARKQQSLG